MDEIKAGVTLMTKFCHPDTSIFKGYVNYIDREEAQRAKHTARYNLYQDYMGNPRKTGGIFTDSLDELTPEQLATLKNSFQHAQDKGSMMWQTVISFDNRWLEENHLYDSASTVLDDTKLKNAARAAMRKMLKNEDFEDALWSGAIHYNTDNIHIHIATVDPNLTRRKKSFIYTREDGSTYAKKEYVGKFKLKSLQIGKSVVVNSILEDKENNRMINDIIRKSIIDQKKQILLSEDRELRKLFLDIYVSLPHNMSLWNYNSNSLNSIRPKLDKLTDQYIQIYHAEEYAKLLGLLAEQSSAYNTAYGNPDSGDRYLEGKLQDLHARMGNAILREMVAFRKSAPDRRTDAGSKSKNPANGQRPMSGKGHRPPILDAFLNKDYSSIQEFNKAYWAFKKSCQKTWEEILNENQYEAMQNAQLAMEEQSIYKPFIEL